MFNESNILGEKNKFLITIDNGEKRIKKYIDENKYQTNKVINASKVFQLYDTYSFPPEITNEFAVENGMTTNINGFNELYKKYQEMSRNGALQKFKGGLADNTSETASLHTATHLLHKALQLVLGEHAKQKGSNITCERLKFDFSHNQKMTPEEIQRVEELVNSIIQQGVSANFKDMPYQSAIKEGTEGIFADKYGQIVKVYSIGDFSTEICGGPHIDNTSKMGTFKIIKEKSVAAGIRRIKAILKL